MFVGAAIIAISTAGCGKITESVVEKAAEAVCEDAQKEAGTTEDCNVDVTDDGVNLDTGDGNVSVGGDVDIPDGFPEYQQINGAKPQATVKAGGAFVVTYAVDNAEEAGKTLVDQATAAGCSNDDAMSTEVSSENGSLTILKCTGGIATITAAETGVNISFTPEN